MTSKSFFSFYARRGGRKEIRKKDFRKIEPLEFQIGSTSLSFQDWVFQRESTA